jgi:branched-chain amino acid aminotransferase
MTITKSEHIWFNGQLVPWEEAQVHVAVHALHYGSSIYEGIRAYKTDGGPAIFCLTPHIDRMFNSARIYRMEVPFSKDEVSRAIVETVKANGHQACYIRPLLFRGFDGLSLDSRSCPVEMVIITIDWGSLLGSEAIENGVDVGVSSWRRMSPNAFPTAAKIGGQYINSQMIVMEAAEHGYAEGIALDSNGFVSEGSGENIFVVSDGRIITPPRASSILPGVTRRCVFALAEDLGYQVQEEMIPREYLYTADEVFFTGTAAEITPIRSVDRIPVGNGGRGPITEKLQAEFFGITSGKIPDRHGWLTLVS